MQNEHLTKINNHSRLKRKNNTKQPRNRREIPQLNKVHLHLTSYLMVSMEKKQGCLVSCPLLFDIVLEGLVSAIRKKNIYKLIKDTDKGKSVTVFICR